MEEAGHPKLDRLAQWIDERGYLVCASANRYEMGHIIEAWIYLWGEPRLHHPIKVFAETDLNDFLDQGEFVYGNRDPPFSGYVYFYRCITD